MRRRSAATWLFQRARVRRGAGLGLLAAVLLWPQSASSLRVGEGHVLSSVAQPLTVRIPIELDGPAERDAADALTVRMVPSSQYPRFGVARALVDPQSVRVTLSGEGGRYTATLSTLRPVTEPLAVLVFEVELGSSHVIRQLPLIFDVAPPFAGADADAAAIPPPPAAAELDRAPPPAALPSDRPAAPRDETGTTAPASRTAAPAERTRPLDPADPPFLRPPGLRLVNAFSSYAEMVAEGLRPAPAPVAPAPADAEPAAAAPPPSTADQPAPPPRSGPAPRGAAAEHKWRLWLLVALLTAWGLLRRRPVQPSQYHPAPHTPATPAPAAAKAPEPAADALPPGIIVASPILPPVDPDLDLKRLEEAERAVMELEAKSVTGLPTLLKRP